MALFHRGFREYLVNGKYSDLTLVSQHNERFRVHRLILAHSSEYFSRLLLGEFRERHQTSVELKYPDPDNVFPIALQFMYSGEAPISTENSIPLLAIADHYLIPELRAYCKQFIMKNINRSNALSGLKKAVEIQSFEIIEFCSSVISKGFDKIPNQPADYAYLPFSVFKNILCHPYLAVKGEFGLFECIVEYVEILEGELSEEQISELMECVRFSKMSFQELQQCSKCPLVPKQLIIETLMHKLRRYEMPDNLELSSEPPNVRFQKRISCTTFEYEFDFDANGVIYYIATSGRTAAWSNPHTSGQLHVSSSQIEVGNASELLNRNPSELWTKDVPASWFTIDFGKCRTVHPSHYTLRHGGNYRADSLRTWDIQGSLDGSNWTVLKRHDKDTSLSDKFASHTWNLPGVTSAFRYFRILQTGRNSSAHNFLVLSGIEFYGDLYEWSQD
eukprot:TRINITY_DN10026_c0_g1_i1.p1 TRINITY_DN10026_c0_g1~~TRINITY_DN10026_c0_g1_i1.p1  ORF type:complete len:446 (-),score=70.30 TRINITY_DN10026_c0_g1_i1:46-1383(-)